MNFPRKYPSIIVLIIAVIVALNVSIQKDFIKTRFYKFETTVASITKPIGWGFQKFIGSIVKVYQNYFQLVDIKSKYIKLQQDYQIAQTQLHMVENLIQENQKLKNILNFKETTKFDFIPGKIIGYDPSFTFKSIKINLGKRDGIQPGMGVLSPVGVVGVVVRVQNKTSDLLLITDPNSNLDTIITRNQSRGILQGKLSRTMRFKYFDPNLNIWVGDKIVTNGLTGSFPAYIPVGTVIKVKKHNDDFSQIVEVEPAVDFTKLNEVLVLKTTDPAIETMRELGGRDWIENVMNVGKKDEID